MNFSKNLVWGLIGSAALAFTPTMASAASFTSTNSDPSLIAKNPAGAVAVTIKVLEKTATLVGLLSDTLTLSNATNWSELDDDHPLYSSGNTSPSLVIQATQTSFNLLLKQPLEIGESEDDEPVTISGTVKVPYDDVQVDGWQYSLTFTYEQSTVSDALSLLKVAGTLQHLIVPKGHKEKGPGAGLSVNATVVALPAPYPNPPKTLTGNGNLDKQPHGGGHFNTVTTNTIQVTCCTPTLGNFTDWEYRLIAVHPDEDNPKVPEPSSAIGLLTLASFGITSILRRKMERATDTRNGC